VATTNRRRTKPRVGNTRNKTPIPSPQAKERATLLAKKMPLVHFPANARLDEWWEWSGLKSKAARGQNIEPGPFGELRSRHVFMYGGPCCYYHEGCIGDAVIYFAPGAEAGRKGGATPFDSGSLEDDPPSQRSKHERQMSSETWYFLKKRQRFSRSDLSFRKG
jgi:hypothetical protein